MAQDPSIGITTVEIRDKVLVEGCIPFGINLSYGNDSPYASPWAKDRIHASFEGTTYRNCLTGYIQDGKGMAVWVGTPPGLAEIHIGARFTVLNGPGKGQSGTIKDIIQKEFSHQGKEKDFTYYVFDRDVPPTPSEFGLPGLLIERFALDEGLIGEPHDFWRPNCGQKETVPRTDVLHGDVRPGSKGRAVCHLIAPDPKQTAFIRFSTFRNRLGDNNGPWRVSFWAKAKAGTPTLQIEATVKDPVVPPVPVALEKDWREYNLTIDVEGIPEPDWSKPGDSVMMFFIFRARGGEVLLDEVSAQKADEQNPSACRDDLIATLKRLNVGSVRVHQQGGSTVDNILTPARYSHGHSSIRSAKKGPYAGKGRHWASVGEVYGMCEYVGCDPWYSLPGTLHKEEVVNFMEYIGAPPDVGYGRLRAEHGHPEPWTDVFRFIHVEFGNEAWNSALPYHSSGFDGSDYWTDLIAAAKASPHYRENVLFHPAGQAGHPGRNEGIMRNTRNGDRFGVAPYMLTRVYRKDLDFQGTDERLFRWLLAWPIFRSRDPRGAMFQNHEFAKEAGYEMSIYEFNHHTLEQEGVTLEERKKIFTTLGGALNVVDTMLLMLKEHGIRIQNAFPLASGADHGMWDFVMTMSKGHERYRPTFLAMETVNKVIGGDLVETVHSGADPTWSAEGVFFTEWKKEPENMTYENIPCIMSYAFKDGEERGLILVNLDVTRALPVSVKLPDKVAGDKASSYLLTADSITANNEWDVGEPQVSIRQEELPDFASGTTVTLPAHSLMALKWKNE